MKMLGNRVLIKREEASEKRGLIIIPERSRSKPQEGVVVEVGPEVQTVVKGDRVLFGKWSVLEVNPYGCIIREPDLMAVME